MLDNVRTVFHTARRASDRSSFWALARPHDGMGWAVSGWDADARDVMQLGQMGIRIPKSQCWSGKGQETLLARRCFCFSNFPIRLWICRFPACLLALKSWGGAGSKGADTGSNGEIFVNLLYMCWLWIYLQFWAKSLAAVGCVGSFVYMQMLTFG